MLNAKIYSSIYKHNNNKMPINNYHNSQNSYLDKKERQIYIMFNFLVHYTSSTLQVFYTKK